MAFVSVPKDLTKVKNKIIFKPCGDNTAAGESPPRLPQPFPVGIRHTVPPLRHRPVWHSDSRTGHAVWIPLSLTYLSISPFGFLRQELFVSDNPSH